MRSSRNRQDFTPVDRNDAARIAAERCVAKLINSGSWLVLTDYIIDESCTLAKARAGAHAAIRLLEIVE